MSGFNPAEELRKERRAAADAASCFVQACRNSDATGFYEAVDLINAAVGGWTVAMRKFAETVRSVSPEIKSAFRDVWIESKMLPLGVGDHRALCDAVRVLLPRYLGPTVRLFRGAGAEERRRRLYGICWSSDIAVADRFAQQRQSWDGGSVLLETVAPEPAIISAIDYPNPLTREEIRTLKRKYPDVHISEFHDEREYIVDRRYLNAVTVVRRYLQQSVT
jgi:hypothetical protein